MLGTISAFADRHRETKKMFCVILSFTKWQHSVPYRSHCQVRWPAATAASDKTYVVFSTHQHMTRHYVASHWQICWTSVARDGVMYSNLLGQTVTSWRGEHSDLLPHHPMGAVQPNIIHVTPRSKKKCKKYKWISRVLDSSIKTSQWWQIIHLWQIANTRVKSQGVWENLNGFVYLCKW